MCDGFCRDCIAPSIISNVVSRPLSAAAAAASLLRMASEATELAAAIKRPVMVMKELRQTERAYLDSLLFLQDQYIPQIYSVLPDMVERIFLGVERIIPMHQKLFEAFEAVDLDTIDTMHALQASLDMFVGAFIEQKKSFGIYSSYINAFEQSRGDVVELMQVTLLFLDESTYSRLRIAFLLT